MATMDQDPGNAVGYMVREFAEEALVFVEERADEELNLGV